MKFATLFTLQIVRAGSNQLPLPQGLAQLESSARHPLGERGLERHHLLLRQEADGLRVLISLEEDGTPFIAFDSLSLWFELHQQSADLAHSVDLTDLQARRPAIFRNTAANATLKLENEPGDQAAVPMGNPPLAWVELRGLAASDWVTPRRFLLELSPRQVHWVYYVVTDRLDRVPSISDAVASRAFDFDLNTFARPQTAGANDRIAEALLAEHPQAKVHRLSSKRSPPADGLPLKGLRLSLADQTCITDLPPPPAHQWMPWPLPNNPSQAARYTVIRL
jgi:hypothetical protein